MFVLEDILETWAKLKEIRVQQNFAATTVSIVVYKQEANKEEDQAAFECSNCHVLIGLTN